MLESSRYAREAAYFDREAERASRTLAAIDPIIVDRYRRNERPRFNKEFRLSLLRPLAGKHVLEIGCGDGEAAVLLASLGARVTGVDVSARSIDLAESRAELSGVRDRTCFVCAPLMRAELPRRSFDAVWGDGILHHVIDEIDGVMERVVTWAKHGATCVFTEPVSFSKALRALRAWVPLPAEGTPDERPLEAAEVAAMTRRLDAPQARPYLLFARLAKLVLVDESMERSPRWRRALADALFSLDEAVLPGAPGLAGQIVVWGRAP
jgi:2-polyprenyl-3-methyl-5-hydroxy-6-metoxy-1,4-benzoquinol methylase